MGILENLKPLATPVVKVETNLVIPDFSLAAPAGVQMADTAMVMVMIRNYGTTVRGAFSASGFHRLECIRFVSLADITDPNQAEAWMRVGPGKSQDTMFRPLTRTSLRMFQSPPISLDKVQRPVWFAAYKKVGEAISWAKKACTEDDSNWLGLILVVSHTVIKLVDNDRFGVYDEASILGIQHLELVKLDRYDAKLEQVMDQATNYGVEHADVFGLAE